VRTAVVAVAFLLALTTPSPGQTLSPGTADTRSFGKLRLDYTLEPDHERAEVTLSLDGSFVGQALLVPSRKKYRFSFTSGNDTASGSLRVAFVSPPQLSSLVGNFEVGSASDSTPFRGTLATWVTPPGAIALEDTYALSPELSVKTLVLGPAENNVQVEFYDGSVLLTTVAMTQASPHAVISEALIYGLARIDAGATLDLTIPTAQQRGQVILQTTFQSSSIPPTAFSAAVATWSL
jgi:hypothetical protein